MNASEPSIATSQADEPATGDEPASTARPQLPAKPGKPGTDWWSEIKGVFWLILAVLAFHSFIAKPFYIPTESMMPTLIKGDRLVVSKYPYGWSWVSPSFHVLPPMEGRLLGSLPDRGDIVIVTPPGQKADYIKRVVGLPGDELEMIDGQLILNGVPVQREEKAPALFPVDANVPCTPDEFMDARIRAPDGRTYCRLPVFRETLPNGRSYDTIDMGYSPVDDFARIRIPEDHVFLMGDNRDKSADSRVASERQGLGGAVPVENIGGRAELITFSLDGSSQYLNPVSWFTALRGGRAGTSLHPAQTGPAEAEAAK